MLDLFHNLQFEESVEYGAQTSSVDGAEVDMAGADRLLFVIRHGAWTSGDHAFAVEHSDVSGSGFAAVTEGEGLVPVDAPAFTDVLDATADDSYQTLEYRGGKQFVRVAATLGNTPSAIWGIFAVKGSLRHANA